MDFAEWLVNKRGERDMTQNELAMKSVDLNGRPIGPSELSKIEQGKRRASPGQAIRIARALGVDYLETLALTGYIHPDEVNEVYLCDNPDLKEIWQAIIALSWDELSLVKTPITAICDACRSKGKRCEVEIAEDLGI